MKQVLATLAMHVEDRVNLAANHTCTHSCSLTHAEIFVGSRGGSRREAGGGADKIPVARRCETCMKH